MSETGEFQIQFQFATATQIRFGAGILSEAGSAAKGLGNCALVVFGKEEGRAAPLLQVLGKHGLRTALFSVPGEPEIATVDKGLGMAREECCELVIGFGGGSAIDAGKAIAAMLANPGEVLDYLEVIGRGKALTEHSAPFIAIPTTAGTGSEVTRNAVLGSPEHKVKVSLRSPFMLPTLALVDPELTYDLPPALSASTGMDALTQLIEPYVSVRANPLTDGLCIEGMKRAARALPEVFENGSHRSARQDMCVAALFSGLALANAGLGAVHGFAGPIGGCFRAPHGAICAALLPHIMSTNLSALRQRQPAGVSLDRYAHLARLLTGVEDATADDGVAWVRKLVSDLRIPRLGSYRIGAEDIRELAQKAGRASSMKANPIVLTQQELEETLEKAC